MKADCFLSTENRFLSTENHRKSPKITKITENHENHENHRKSFCTFVVEWKPTVRMMDLRTANSSNIMFLHFCSRMEADGKYIE